MNQLAPTVTEQQLDQLLKDAGVTPGQKPQTDLGFLRQLVSDHQVLFAPGYLDRFGLHQSGSDLT